MSLCNWRSPHVFFAVHKQLDGRAHAIRCALEADQPSRIQRLNSRATAAKTKVFGSYICSRTLQTRRLTHHSLAVTTFERAKRQAETHHFGLVMTRSSILSTGKNS